jgi:hypothetical protein
MQPTVGTTGTYVYSSGQPVQKAPRALDAKAEHPNARSKGARAEQAHKEQAHPHAGVRELQERVCERLKSVTSDASLQGDAGLDAFNEKFFKTPHSVESLCQGLTLLFIASAGMPANECSATLGLLYRASARWKLPPGVLHANGLIQFHLCTMRSLRPIDLGKLAFHFRGLIGDEAQRSFAKRLDTLTSDSLARQEALEEQCSVPGAQPPSPEVVAAFRQESHLQERLSSLRTGLCHVFIHNPWDMRIAMELMDRVTTMETEVLLGTLPVVTPPLSMVHALFHELFLERGDVAASVVGRLMPHIDPDDCPTVLASWKDWVPKRVGGARRDNLLSRVEEALRPFAVAPAVDGSMPARKPSRARSPVPATPALGAPTSVAPARSPVR